MEGKVASCSLKKKKKRPFSLSVDEDDQSNKQKKKPMRFPKVKEQETELLLVVKNQQQSIPSMVDGLKLVQRKILFIALKDNLVTDITISKLSIFVLGFAGYNGNRKSVDAAIIGMAQDFVGTNNISLLNSGRQCGLGSRYEGDKVHPKTWQMDTNLTPIARFLFPKDDDIILNYLNEDGKRIEPTWYAPVIPMILVNGTKGFGKGWSTFVPSYNPKDLCANVRRLLRGEPMVPIDPWYKGFQGTIEKTTIKESGASYTVSGIIEQIDETTLRITELPLRRWTMDYNEFLKNKIKEKFIKKVRNRPLLLANQGEYDDDDPVHFEIIMSKKNLRIAKEEGLMKKFKLTTTISTSNMYLFDPKGVIKKYDNPEQILQEFFHLRLELYKKRNIMMLQYLELEQFRLEFKMEYIHGVFNGGNHIGKTKENVLTDLEEKNLLTLFQKTSQASTRRDIEVDEERFSSFYKDLFVFDTRLAPYHEFFELQKENLCNQVNELKIYTPEDLWIKDLDALEQKLDAIAEVTE